MKKAAFIVALLFLIFSLGPAFGQETEPQSEDDAFHHLYIGLSGGYAYNTLYTSDGYRTFTHYEAGHAFTAGLTARWAFFNWLSLQIEAAFIQKNYSQVRTEQFAPVQYTITNSFIDFPIFANLNWPVYKGLGLFVNLGVSLGVWVHSRTKGVMREFTQSFWDGNIPLYYSYDEDVPFDSRRDNQFDAGLLAGLGVKYDFKPFCVYIEGRFNYGLTDLQKDYMKNKVPRINDTITVQAGIQFNKSILPLFQRKKGIRGL
jgi:hypothetical protein